MTFDITCTFRVKRLKNESEALDMGTNIMEHVQETFNDDESIEHGINVSVQRKRGA